MIFSRLLREPMSPPDAAEVLEFAKELDRLREEQEQVLLKINILHQKLQNAPEVVENPGDDSLSRLKHLYTCAKELSKKEVHISCMLVRQLDAMVASETLEQQQRDQRRKCVKSDLEVSKLLPSGQPNDVACASLEGEQVAAKVTRDDADTWFVARVIYFDTETKEFEVLDEDPDEDEEEEGQRKYKLPLSCIIPFPKRSNPSSAPQLPPGKLVLAVFPDTTTLYKAVVVNRNRKRKTDDYLLEFDGDEDDANGHTQQRSVPFDRVVPLPYGHQ